MCRVGKSLARNLKETQKGLEAELWAWGQGRGGAQEEVLVWGQLVLGLSLFTRMRLLSSLQGLGYC